MVVLTISCFWAYAGSGGRGVVGGGGRARSVRISKLQYMHHAFALRLLVVEVVEAVVVVEVEAAAAAAAAAAVVLVVVVEEQVQEQ